MRLEGKHGLVQQVTWSGTPPGSSVMEQEAPPLHPVSPAREIRPAPSSLFQGLCKSAQKTPGDWGLLSSYGQPKGGSTFVHNPSITFWSKSGKAGRCWKWQKEAKPVTVGIWWQYHFVRNEEVVGSIPIISTTRTLIPSGSLSFGWLRVEKSSKVTVHKPSITFKIGLWQSFGKGCGRA